MRVTQGMMNSQLLRDYNNSLEKMYKLDEQMATGKRINEPSDDPTGASLSLRYRSDLEANAQYQRNVDSATSWLNYTDTAISETNDVLQKAREIAVQGASDTNSPESRKALAAEVDQLYEQLVDIGNSQFNGKYIFNGQKTDQPPYDYQNAASTTPDQGEIELEITQGTKVPINTSGAGVFGDPSDTDNAFKVLEDLKNALNNDDTQGIEDSLANLDSRLDKIMQEWADVGGRANRVDLTDNRLKNEELNLNNLLSENEDADMAKLSVELSEAEAVYEASLSVGADILQPSLVDFLK